ncbi:MAG TPA: prepilin-type N-terminal cleavage/methylation domain-containing protein [Candidatus Eremiobacteraceae bacterium]|nr:prepilin-type N-terminal cleavage/methylation domain-containing protein [Candidatus Eremiobacteraceae bacterium]
MKQQRLVRKQRGFTLLETMIAMAILSFGVLGLASFFTQGLKNSNTVQMQYIANQKAQEAMESIFEARDANLLTFSEINNVSNGGVFLNGAQPLLAPGPDGIVGTADDDTSNPDKIITGPGPDNILGTADDTYIPLNPWMTRTITITPVTGYTNMVQVNITINYQYEGQVGQVQLVTYLSAYS